MPRTIQNRRRQRYRPILIPPMLCVLLFQLTGCSVVTGGVSATPTSSTTAMTPTIRNLIPLPVSVSSGSESFTLAPTTGIYVEPASSELIAIGQYLADRLNPSTGYGIQVVPTSGAPAVGNIYLTTVGSDPALGNEGYQLSVTREGIRLVAAQPEGLFRGIQTLRQLLPPAIESPAVQAGPWSVATGAIIDYPRFAWRGAMLDVARHFFSVADVKRYIDLMAYYKLNRLHLHLSDDQGWRIQINSWPQLTTHGGSTAVGGGAGGYYTKAEYAEIVAYAQSRYIMVIPEIDMPGHTNAALASYDMLNCDEVAPALYTGIEVGFSALCLRKEITYTFIDDVIRELAAMTPGPYFHIGGDEASTVSASEYTAFINRVQDIVQGYGKQMIGWEEIAVANLSSTSVVQFWDGPSEASLAVQKGAKLVVAPAKHAYLDMKYDASTALGHAWAGYTDVRDAYSWDPATQIPGVAESNILGIEAPLWTETVTSMDELEYMAFPRLAGHAEIGWSPGGARSWPEYSARLATHGPRWVIMDVNFYRSPEVAWQ